MRLNRFYSKRLNLREGSSIKIEESDTKHIRKVLRLTKGDEIVIFNGEKEFLATLDIVSGEAVMATIIKQLREEDFSKPRVEITLFQALLKAGKFDDILEKTTELGVDYIAPIECEFSQSRVENAKAKIERWNKILVAASQQSERIRVPDLIEPMKFEEALEHFKEFDKVYFLTTRDQAKKIEKIEGENPQKVAIFIGPEGGFSPKEIALVKEKGIELYSLGENILRSETAAIFATGLLHFMYN